LPRQRPGAVPAGSLVFWEGFVLVKESRTRRKRSSALPLTRRALTLLAVAAALAFAAVALVPMLMEVAP
jgi:hypothetical protein